MKNVIFVAGLMFCVPALAADSHAADVARAEAAKETKKICVDQMKDGKEVKDPKTTVVLDPTCDAAFPGARSAIVTIDLADGRTLRHHQTTRHGDPDDPLTDAELTDKFYELTTPAIGRPAAETLLAQLWQIDQLPDTRLAPVTLARAAE